jgi:mono/diheme cytochrome c family protein
VAIVAGCRACHDSPDGAAWTGGFALTTPFGKLLSANITQDKATGIGTWSSADFEAALRDGKRKDGSLLYPAMPYTHYTSMTDGDIADLWAFMKTIKPVSKTVKVNRLPFPFSVRSSLLAWNALYFDKKPFEPDPQRGQQWNRGAYIVEALAHCGSCHTPRDPLGGPIKSRRFKGASIENWYAPDISNGIGSLIRDWSVERLASFLKGNDGRNHVAVGSMAKVVDDFGQMTDEDVQAVAVYLKSFGEMTPSGGQSSASNGASPQDTETATLLFKQYCAACHQEDGKGVPGIAASLVGAGGVIAAEPDNVTSVLLEGIAPNDKYGVMPSFRHSLNDAEIAAITNYVRTSWGNNAPANATPWAVAAKRSQTSTSPEVMTASTCVNVAQAAISQQTRDELAHLASKPELDREALKQVLADYAGTHPNADPTSILAALGGTYCLAVARTGVDRNTVIKRELEFFAALMELHHARQP